MDNRLHPCSACPRYHPPIPGDGPVPCSIMVIGEAPARRELEGQRRDRTGRGRVLVGDSGVEYTDQYLPLAGLTRADVYTTNIAKCADSSLANPTPERALTCAEFHLHSELREVQPQVIITLGAVALHTLFPGHDLELEHGRPFEGSWGGWRGIVIPMYHPAAGLHQAGRFMTLMREDWKWLGKLIQIGFYRAKDEYPNPDYQECVDADDVISYMGGKVIDYLAVDTEVESLKSMVPFCMSFSHTPGTARVIRAMSREALQALGYYVHDRLRLVFHNAVFDPPVLHKTGIETQVGRFVDTMMMAYHLGDTPQSLKTLAYRLCGMEMHEFKDVAGPASKSRVLDWLMDAHLFLDRQPCWATTTCYAHNCFLLDAPGVTEATKKSEARKIVKAMLTSMGQEALLMRGRPVMFNDDYNSHLTKTVVSHVNKLKTGSEKTVQRINSLVTALIDNPDSTDPWDRVSEWSDDVVGEIVRAAGPMPELSIVHVPWPEALYYSARDADATIRILPILKSRLSGVGRETL